ncbi:MAG: hypothetical protein LBR70_06925 [Lactobacillaceae bacterium]|jgi:hypothetical protein|nr:hypothetical protein [Lactobacillaceae bacterium]
MEDKNNEEKMGRKLLDEYRGRKLRAKTDFRLENPQKIISDAIARDYHQMGENMRSRLAREIVLKPEGVMLTVEDTQISVSSLDVKIAESIELINCGTSSREEYHDWINVGQDVIRDMNTDGVTPQELDTRNLFLADLNQREVELMTCLALYQRAIGKDPRLQARYSELYNKLQKLREIRSAVKNSTKSVSDKLEEEKKKERADKIKLEETAIKAMIVTTKALSVYDKLTDDDKKKLNMFHGDDYKDFNFYNHLTNYFLYNGDIRFNNKNVGEERKFETSPLESNLLARRSTLESYKKHIGMLRGVVDEGKRTNFHGWTVDANAYKEQKYQNHGVFKKTVYEKVSER